jgi:hypothetical protein
MSYEIHTRPMAPRERVALEQMFVNLPRARGARSPAAGLTIGALIGLLAGTVPAATALSRGSTTAATLFWVSSGLVGIGIAALMHWRATAPLRERRALYDWELKEGVVTEFVCSISHALEIYNAEKEKTTYLLQVDDNRVLYLNGQYLYDAASGQGFPTERFRLARAPHSWEVLTLECEGPRLNTASFVDLRELRRAFDDGEVADGRISDFVRPA